MTLNFAHRGASGMYPENTMLAFEKAIEAGCHGIETDVQRSKDGVLVLIHDEELQRTTGAPGLVPDYTLSELKGLSSSEHIAIPTAEELILLCKANSIQINFEIKNNILPYGGIEEELIRMIYKHGLKDQVSLSSFNHMSMVHCKRIDSSIRTGLLYMQRLYQPELYGRSAGADALHPWYKDVDEELMNAARREGLMVNVYTVDEEHEMKALIGLGVDAIITNHPERMKRILP